MKTINRLLVEEAPGNLHTRAYGLGFPGIHSNPLGYLVDGSISGRASCITQSPIGFRISAVIVPLKHQNPRDVMATRNMAPEVWV